MVPAYKHRSAVAEQPARQHAPAILVDGWPVNIRTLEEAVERIVSDAEARQSFACFTLNLDHLVKLRENPTFRRAYASARYVTADGAPVARMVRRRWPDAVRTTGADLLIPLCQAAAEHDLPIYLFGTSAPVLEASIKELSLLSGGRLRIAGYEAPPNGFDPEGPEADLSLERIARSGARLCFVMLGAPKQELLAARAVERGIPCGFVGVGAAADFIVGHQVRAPRLMQTMGMEWLWRLSTNPRRLAMRYARCALLLARLEFQALRAVRGR